MTHFCVIIIKTKCKENENDKNEKKMNHFSIFLNVNDNV